MFHPLQEEKLNLWIGKLKKLIFCLNFLIDSFNQVFNIMIIPINLDIKYRMTGDDIGSVRKHILISCMSTIFNFNV